LGRNLGQAAGGLPNKPMLPGRADGTCSHRDSAFPSPLAIGDALRKQAVWMILGSHRHSNWIQLGVSLNTQRPLKVVHPFQLAWLH
jgi:hypothetical protein